MSTFAFGRRWLLAAALPVLLLTAACERPPVDVEQTGYRGTGMQNPENPRMRAEERDRHQAPEPLAAAPDAGPRAGQIYQNVEVLGDLSVGQFQRVMRAMTQWVAPEQGCAYCHVAGNFAAEDEYTKIVSRRMLEMTRHLNARWEPHVADTGVTCYTCHRGHNVPQELWFYEPGDDRFADSGGRERQNAPLAETGFSSLPHDALEAYLEGDGGIRVQGETALPEAVSAGTKVTERTYGLMVHMSRSLGVSCQTCHNSRAFGSWEQSPPQRTTAWHGIRMVRELNNDFLDPLTGVFPDHRLGPRGDVGKVNCATCHQGIQKPLYGASMVEDYPSLIGERPGEAGESAALPHAAAAASLVAEYLETHGRPAAGDGPERTAGN